LADRLFPGAVVALIGPLGAGKTTLVRAVAAGLGADPSGVASPTFALIHEYAGRLPLYHFDAYRLPDVDAFVDLGSAEYFGGAGVCLVEWADRVAAALPVDHLRIDIELISRSRRRAILTATGQRHARIVDCDNG
jgi:tRNA threonylcarbamoyladenosine biosynthesis protein TsaE